MPRNFRRRVEIMYPILDETLKRRLFQDILEAMAQDNVKCWLLGKDGRYRRVTEGEPRFRSQEIFMAQARSRAREQNTTLKAQERTPLDGNSPIGKLRRRSTKKKKRKK
jgi:polyphosphate kinase